MQCTQSNTRDITWDVGGADQEVFARLATVQEQWTMVRYKIFIPGAFPAARTCCPGGMRTNLAYTEGSDEALVPQKCP